MIYIAVKRVKRIKEVKVVLRVARVNGEVLERDVVGAINIGLRDLTSKGSPVALARRGPCVVGEANDPTLMSNPADRNTSIQKHKQILLAGKR